MKCLSKYDIKAHCCKSLFRRFSQLFRYKKQLEHFKKKRVVN